MNLIAIFPAGATELTVNGLHQWDYGRKLDIHATDLPAIVEVHFACPGMDEAIVRVGSAAGGVATVAIPDRCLEQSSPITAWVYEVGENYGQTLKTLTLNIKARTRPQVGGEIPTDISDKYTEAVGAMNETIETLKNGKVTVGNATRATQADSALVADNALAANHTKTWVVSSLGGLLQMIKTNPACSIGISIRTEQRGIEIPTTTGKVFISNWAYGTLTIDEIGDASIHLTAYTGEVFHLFYNGNGGYWVKGDIKVTSATHADNATTANKAVSCSYINEVDYEGAIVNGIYLVECYMDNTDEYFTCVMRIYKGHSTSYKDIWLGYRVHYSGSANTLTVYEDADIRNDASIRLYKILGSDSDSIG